MILLSRLLTFDVSAFPMEKLGNICEVEQAVLLLREHIETIRINMGILEILKQNGRITDKDRLYIEITDLDRKNQVSFNKFVFTDLPGLMAADYVSGSPALKRSYLDWAEDLHLSLSYLDRMIKNYMHKIAEIDNSLNKSIKHLEIKDKRFWDFLDRAQGKDGLFESFEEPDNSDGLNQVKNPEERKE